MKSNNKSTLTTGIYFHKPTFDSNLPGGKFALSTEETENAIRGASDRALGLFDGATQVRGIA